MNAGYVVRHKPILIVIVDEATFQPLGNLIEPPFIWRL